MTLGIVTFDKSQMDALQCVRWFYPYFTNRRQFFLPSGLGRIIGKPPLSSPSNGWVKYYQVDTQRRRR